MMVVVVVVVSSTLDFPSNDDRVPSYPVYSVGERLQYHRIHTYRARPSHPIPCHPYQQSTLQNSRHDCTTPKTLTSLCIPNSPLSTTHHPSSKPPHPRPRPKIATIKRLQVTSRTLKPLHLPRLLLAKCLGRKTFPHRGLGCSGADTNTAFTAHPTTVFLQTTIVQDRCVRPAVRELGKEWVSLVIQLYS